LRAVSGEDLRRFAADWLRRDRRAVVTVIPRRSGAGEVAAGEDDGSLPGPVAEEGA
jgi:hypothetical protein